MNTKTQCDDCNTIFTGDGVDMVCERCEGKLHEIIYNPLLCGKLINLYGGGTKKCPNELPCPMTYHSGEVGEDLSEEQKRNIRHSECKCEHPVIESNMTVEYCRKCFRLMSKPTHTTVGSELSKCCGAEARRTINNDCDHCWACRECNEYCEVLPSTNKVSEDEPLKIVKCKICFENIYESDSGNCNSCENYLNYLNSKLPEVTTPAPLKSEGWEERYEDELAPIFYKINTKGSECTENKHKVKSFIRDLLAREKKEWVDYLANEKNDYETLIRADERQSIIKKIRASGLHLGYKNNVLDLLNNGSQPTAE